MFNYDRLPTSQEKRRMIAEAAYFRAEREGFRGNDPMQDWLSAEAEIEKYLKLSREAEPRQHESAAYNRMRVEMKKILAGTQDTVSADTIRHAIEKVNRELKEMGEFVPETIDKASKTLKREIAAAAESMGSGWETFSEKSLELFAVWKDRSANFLNQASRALNDWVSRHRNRS
jgi:hypothetical protein